MDTIKHTEFTASSNKIEITGDDRTVKIVEENVHVNIVSRTVAEEPPTDKMLSAEALLTEAALVETPSEEAIAEAAAAEEPVEDTSTDVAFTEAGPVEPPAEDAITDTPAEEVPAEDTPSDVSFTEAAYVDPLSSGTLSDQAEIKAFAGMEALKAGEVAEAGAQALARAIEKRESRPYEEPQYEDSFADLEAIEMMAIEMVKKEQEAKSSSAPTSSTPADAEATIEADATSADVEPPVCPADVYCGVYVTKNAKTGAVAEASFTCPQGTPCCALDDATEAATREEAANAPASATDNIPEAQLGQAPQQTQPKPRNDNGTIRVIGVRFRTAGKVYFFDPGQWEVRHGTHVIVETVRGIEYGTVVGVPMDISAAKVPQPLKEVIRVATPEDTETERRNRAKEKEAYRICQEKIKAHGLDMKLINAEYTFDNSKVLFYFTADGRVDFRDLVKDLASVFRTRIELRQIGVRDETKILGGYGICGRPLCCHTWMSDFIPVSIKMAKEQNLSLNPGKISGVCGRLMCCLKNESDTYEELNRTLPRVGDEVQGKDGLSGQVESVNVLRQTVRILVEVDDEKEYHEYGVDDITVLRRRRRGGNRNRKDNADPKEVQELERLENQERQPSRDRGNRKDRGNNGDRQERGNSGNREDRGNNQDRNNSGNGDGYNRQDRGDRRNNRRRNNNNQSET